MTDKTSIPVDNASIGDDDGARTTCLVLYRRQMQAIEDEAARVAVVGRVGEPPRGGYSVDLAR